MIKGLIADIQRASIHDGDGVRTTVFFKGCPLSCKWCHNPECISFEKEILYYPEKCIHCGMCDKGCFSGARVVCGKSMTADEVLSEIMLDVPYYGDTGGVTFSGGEPFAQGKFLNACIDKCKENGINCAVETSLMYFDEEIFKKLALSARMHDRILKVARTTADLAEEEKIRLADLCEAVSYVKSRDKFWGN